MHIRPLLPASDSNSSGTFDLPTMCHVLAGPPAQSDRFVASEVGALRALGHAVVPVLLDGNGSIQPDDAALCAEAVRLAQVETLSALTAAAANPAGLGAAVGFAQRQRTLPSRFLLRDATRLAYVARSRGCAHIHADSAGPAATVAICAARIAGLTVSFTVVSPDLYGPRAQGSDTELALKLGAADFAIAANEDMAVRFRRHAPRATIQAIPRGVAPDLFRPLPGPSNGRLLALGGLATHKGYHAMLVALSNLHPLLRPHVDVVGDGRLAGELAALARDLGLSDHVSFLGARPPAWIAADGPHYQGLVAAGVIAEDGTRDSAPLAIVEAMAMGLPVVATDLPGVREMMDESCGRLIEPGDVSALAEAMVWLADLSPACRATLGAAGRARVMALFTLRHRAMRLSAAVAEAQGRGQDHE
jgi:glycosyltransferase involved in cell wall biosynthesis